MTELHGTGGFILARTINHILFLNQSVSSKHVSLLGHSIISVRIYTLGGVYEEHIMLVFRCLVCNSRRYSAENRIAKWCQIAEFKTLERMAM